MTSLYIDAELYEERRAKRWRNATNDGAGRVSTGGGSGHRQRI